jgi:hypothetical protein
MTVVQPGGGSGSVVRRILLGSQLRRLRESRGITREAAGYSIRASESKISRMELGRVSFKERDVADLLTLYGITEESERAALLGLVREANIAGWWHGYGDVLPSWFQTYVGLEESASAVHSYETTFVHGLLQAEDYSRAVIERGTPGATEEEVERRLALRRERQKLLTSERGPEIVAILDEAVLRRNFGGRKVMRAQLAHLIETAEQPNITVQVVPFEFTGYSAGATGTFTRLAFPEPDISDVVYVEQLTGAMYIDKRDEVDQYNALLARLRADALSPEDTVRRMRALLDRD